MSVQFCPRCKSVLVPMHKGKSLQMKCRKCGYSTKKTAAQLKIVEKVEKKRGVVLLEKDDVPLPITNKVCSRCGNDKSYFWLQQTRSADEPPTQFFRCMKCKHVWREYK